MIVADKEKYDYIIESVWKIYLEETMFSSDPKWLEPVHLMNMKTGEKSIGARQFSKEGFLHKCKTDPEFSEKWGLKIEEGVLSLEERFNIKYPGGTFSVFQENYPGTHKRNNPNELLDAFDVPNKLITITYNNETIEVYE